MDVKETGLTPTEASALIGCKEYTIKELARGKKIPHAQHQHRNAQQHGNSPFCHFDHLLIGKK